MLTQPILLSAAAALICEADPSADESYVLGHARQFVRDGWIQPVKFIGGGKNRRAYLGSYGVVRLAILSAVVRHRLDLGDTAFVAKQMDKIATDDSDCRRMNFNDIVDEFAAMGTDSELEWHFHNYLDLSGRRWGSCSREIAPNAILASISPYSVRVALRPIISGLIDVMRKSAASA